MITATLLDSPNMVAEEHLGPAVYLAAVHDVDGKSVLHWKYNIAKPEFVEVKVLDGKKQDIALIKRPVRRVEWSAAGNGGVPCVTWLAGSLVL